MPWLRVAKKTAYKSLHMINLFNCAGMIHP
jgi:hypothetical protein